MVYWDFIKKESSSFNRINPFLVEDNNTIGDGGIVASYNGRMVATFKIEKNTTSISMGGQQGVLYEIFFYDSTETFISSIVLNTPTSKYIDAGIPANAEIAKLNILSVCDHNLLYAYTNIKLLELFQYGISYEDYLVEMNRRNSLTESYKEKLNAINIKHLIVNEAASKTVNSDGGIGVTHSILSDGAIRIAWIS